MRLTAALCRRNQRWLFKRMWETRGIMKTQPLLVPKPLLNRGVKFEDASKIAAAQHEVAQWVPPVKDDPKFQPPARLEDHPDYHEQDIYEFNTNCRLLEGERQALVLTKSQPFYTLPERVSDLVGVVNIPDQDELVQRYIMQANVWDPTKEKLTPRKNWQNPGWKFKAEFGIPKTRTISILLQNLLRLCQSLGGRFPDLLEARRLATNHHVCSAYDFQGDRRIQITDTSEWMMSSDRPLNPFASAADVEESRAYSLPDMFPLAPTIDLVKQHVYTGQNITGWNRGFRHPHPHTLVLQVEDTQKVGERNAAGLMMCFGQALAQAKNIYGDDVQTLPEPIAMQCLMTDGGRFHFLFFQLNTLDLTSSDGPKNLVWFHDDLMYKKVLPRMAMLRNTRYYSYNPEVFMKILAMYLNGAKFEERQRTAIG